MRRPSYNISKEYENKINEVRIEEGLTFNKLGELSGVAPQTIWSLSQGYISPTYQKGYISIKIKPWVQRIADILRADLSYLFPREICDITNRYDVLDCQIFEMTYGHNPNSKTDAVEELMSSIDDILSIKEKFVILKRFGLNGDIWTLDKISKSLGCTRERVRMIEAKSLRKLRKVGK